MSYEDSEIVLVSKDESEFKVKFGIALMSETIKALSSFPEEADEQEDVSAPTNCHIPTRQNAFEPMLLERAFQQASPKPVRTSRVSTSLSHLFLILPSFLESDDNVI